jgi:predicted ester cyclase
MMNTNQDSDSSGSYISAEQAKALVLRLYEEFDKGNLDGFTAFIGPDFAANVLGNTALDWNGFRQFGGAFRSAFPDGRHVFEYVVADGENVITIGTYEAVHTGNMQGIAPTYRQVTLVVMHLDRVVDGRIVEHRGLANEVDFMRQLGIELAPDQT